jgi:hypothetical protein
LLYREEKFDVGAEPQATQLPLELFDDPEYETCTPEGWLELKKVCFHHDIMHHFIIATTDMHVSFFFVQPNEPGVDAFSRFYNGNEYIWRPCWVKDYDAQEDMFVISFKGEEYKEKFARRLNVRFGIEDESIFFNRIEAAKKLREEIERDIRYHIFVGRQDETHLPKMPTDQLRRILLLGAPRIPEKYAYLVENFVFALQEQYKHGVKETIVEYERLDPNISSAIRPMGLGDGPKQFTTDGERVSVDGMTPGMHIFPTCLFNNGYIAQNPSRLIHFIHSLGCDYDLDHFDFIQEQLFERLIIAHPAIVNTLYQLREVCVTLVHL